MTSKYKNYLGWSIKLVITILTAVFLYSKLSDNQNLNNFLDTIRPLDHSAVAGVLSVVVVLMIGNWLSEAYKWKIMIFHVEPISFRRSVQTILCGLPIGILSPNRIGEYSTRVIFLSPRKRLAAVVVIGVGACAQLTALTVLASIAIPVFLHNYRQEYSTWNYTIIFFSTTYCILLISAYFNMKHFVKLINKARFLKRYRRFFAVLSTYDNMFLLRVLCICFCRLFILITQYYLIINLLIPAISFGQVAVMIVMMLSIHTVIPTIDIIDIGVRGTTAVFLFGFITDQDVAIVASTAVIWFINLITPAIIGLVLIIRLPQDQSANWLKVRA